jgi:hypothetical protein
MAVIEGYQGRMTFSETYREERLINRRARARTARILGRIIGFCLTACLLVALRTDPHLRALVEDTALAVMGSAHQTAAAPDPQAEAIRAPGSAKGSNEAQMLEQLGISGETPKPAKVASQMPQSTVKVNRPTPAG